MKKEIIENLAKQLQNLCDLEEIVNKFVDEKCDEDESQYLHCMDEFDNVLADEAPSDLIQMISADFDLSHYYFMRIQASWGGDELVSDYEGAELWERCSKHTFKEIAEWLLTDINLFDEFNIIDECYAEILSKCLCEKADNELVQSWFFGYGFTHGIIELDEGEDESDEFDHLEDLFFKTYSRDDIVYLIEDNHDELANDILDNIQFVDIHEFVSQTLKEVKK